MLSNAFISSLTRVCVVTATVLTLYLYFYPIWLGCAFPATNGYRSIAFLDTIHQHRNADSENFTSDALAPFRLLVLADPQLEGDSSLPLPEDALIARIQSNWAALKNATLAELPFNASTFLFEFVAKDIPREVNAWRKRLDLLGNDFYLAHIFHTLNWWTKPTHVTVLGDLIGSQWVEDDEFEYRGWRFWNRVFAGGHRVEDEITNMYNNEAGQQLLDMTDPQWKNRIINIAGNHDIGYAGDISANRMERFERTFGKANWDVRFAYPDNNGSGVQPTLHLVVFNSMLLDTPAYDEDLQSQTYAYLNSIIGNRVKAVEDRSSFVLFLTHVPLHKEAGICVDAPFFDFFEEDQDCDERCRPGGLKEQNHLSVHSSLMGALETMFGMSGRIEAAANGKGRPGVILNGHDHEGCDTWHYIPQDNTSYVEEESGQVRTNWQATRWKGSHNKVPPSHTGVREVTLRSMMGSFGGNAGLFSAWFDFERGEWQYDITMCRLGTQHIWWATHVIDVMAVVMVCFNFSIWLFGIDIEKFVEKQKQKQKQTQKEKKKISTSPTPKKKNKKDNKKNSKRMKIE